MDRKIYISATGTIERVRMEVVQMVRTCEVKGCDRKHYAKGMCSKHYSQNWRCENIEKEREYKRTYYYKNRKKILKYQKTHRQTYRKNRIKKQNLNQLKEGVLEANVRGDDESLFNDAEFLKNMGLSCSKKKKDK